MPLFLLYDNHLSAQSISIYIKFQEVYAGSSNRYVFIPGEIAIFYSSSVYVGNGIFGFPVIERINAITE